MSTLLQEIYANSLPPHTHGEIHRTKTKLVWICLAREGGNVQSFQNIVPAPRPLCGLWDSFLLSPSHSLPLTHTQLLNHSLTQHSVHSHTPYPNHKGLSYHLLPLPALFLTLLQTEMTQALLPSPSPIINTVLEER